MKSIVCSLLVSISIFLISCKKEDSTPVSISPVSALNGKWKYASNIGNACNDLVGAIYILKEGTVTAESFPSNSYGWKAGDNILTNMAQTTSPNNFTANGYSRTVGGSIADPNIKVNIVTSSNAQSMTITYTNVCNPVQVWAKTN